LEIFKDVALLLDDAEIDEVFKDTVTGVSDNKKSSSRCTPHRDEVRVWMLPANSKFFNLDGCLEKYGYVYWAQYYHLQKGDIVYIYSSSPDSCVKYKLIVEEHDVQYGAHYDHEEEFFVDKNDFEKSKEHNRFVLLKFISETTSSRLSSHRYETHTKTNYENNEYIYLIGRIIASILPPIHSDDFLANHTFLWNISLTSVQWN